MKSSKKRGIRRILILALLLATGFKAYSFYADNNENKNNYLNNIQVNAEVKDNEEMEEDFNLLTLVNKGNKLSDDYSVDLTTFRGSKVANVLVADLHDMYNAAKKDNIYLEITSAYRTKSEQQEIYDNTVSEFTKSGNPYDLAISLTERTVAEPGYSEHETGLALDFSNTSNYNKRIEMWKWLELNAYKYGFILRYPNGKEYITGITYEQWHYRYVGKKDAIIIYESGKTLEEYLNAENYLDKIELRGLSELP